jgi:hypothetical protein
MTIAINEPRYRASTVVGLLTNPRDKRFGHWRVEVGDDGYRAIYHYGTWMLGVRPDGQINYTSLGHGSVSDQGMMNRLFRALGSDLYYSRAGGASIG